MVKINLDPYAIFKSSLYEAVFRNFLFTFTKMLSRLAPRAVSRVPQLLSRPSRRFASNPPPVNTGHTEPELKGVFDNAFNRERLAVKKHAAATAGTLAALYCPPFTHTCYPSLK